MNKHMNKFFGGERESETRERVACGLELIRALDPAQMSEEAGMGLAYLIDTLQAALREPPIDPEVAGMIAQAMRED